MNAGTTRTICRKTAGDGSRIVVEKTFAIRVIKAAVSSAIRYAGIVTPSTFPAHICLRLSGVHSNVSMMPPSSH